MRMSYTHRKIQILALGCVTLLIICGSLTLFCPMTIHSTEAATHPAHHTTDGAGECMKVLAAPSHLFMEQQHGILLPEGHYSESPADQADQFAYDSSHIDPHLEAPPRYLLLSTLLI